MGSFCPRFLAYWGFRLIIVFMGKRNFISILILVLLSPVSVLADGVSFKTEKGNIYSAGGDVTISERVPGDVTAAGGNVVIAGDTGGDVLAVGGTVHLTGRVGDDARIAGGDLTVDTDIGGEATLAGGEIKLLPGTTIKDDLFAAGGNLTIGGDVGGTAKLYGGSVTLNGTIGKNVEIRTGRLIIGKNAVIKGNLFYASPEKARIAQGAVIKGQTIYEHKAYEFPKKKLLGFLWLWWVIKLVATETAALLLYFLLKKKVERFTALAVSGLGREFLTGFIVLILAGAAIGVLFISVAGYILGLVGTFFYVASILLSSVLGAIVFSGLAGRYVFKKEEYVTWPVILLGVLTYQIIGTVPFLGWLMKFVFLLSAFGALSHLVYMDVKKT
jgi:hypothetical protein